MKLFDSPKKRIHINLTSLIDILFILIIFFSIATRFPIQEGLNLNLPESETGKVVSTSERVLIFMKDENSLFLNEIPFSWEQLDQELKSEIYPRSRSVILNIDQTVPHGKVIQLMDLLKSHAFKKVVFGTEKKSK